MSHYRLVISSTVREHPGKSTAVLNALVSHKGLRWFKKPEQLRRLLDDRQHQTLIVLDGSDLQPLGGIHYLLRSHPSISPKLIFLLDSFEKEHLQFLQLEGCGMILYKNLSQLNTALSVVQNSGWYFCSDLKQSFCQAIAKNEGSTNPSLTNMELQVVQELLKDKTNQQIADSLYISRRTVEYHITSAIQKLGVNSRVGLAVKMLDHFRQIN